MTFVPSPLPTLILTPLRAGLVADSPDTVDLLIRVQAPDAPAADAAARPPQAATLVIDRSGSMSGDPLHQALRCAHYVVDRMRPVDALGLVSFDDKVRRVWPVVPIGDGRALHQAIDTIRAGGSTDLHGGWQEGAAALEGVVGDGVRRVILLSDGQANVGLVDTAAIVERCRMRATQGITTSTFGLSDHFNEELMVAMARAGGGNHYYGDTADDLMEPFQQELELLVNLFMRSVTLSVQAEPGVSVRMMNQLPETAGGWALPDLAWGAEAWALVRLSVADTGRAPVEPHELERLVRLARISVSGRDLDGTPSGAVSADLSLPVKTREAVASLPADELVARRMAELEAAACLNRMRAAAAAGDWASVDRMLADAIRRFHGNAWVQAMLDSMQAIAASREQARMVKEALYSSNRLNTRLAAKRESAILEDAMSPDTPAFLRRKRSQGKG